MQPSLPLFEPPRREVHRSRALAVTGAARRPPVQTPATELTASDLCRGVVRLLTDFGYRTMTEMRLASGRRVDVIGLDGRGRFVVAEVKSSRADFMADQKWPDYLPYCDLFYFAVGQHFPREILPADTGVMIADRYAGVIDRPAESRPMTTARRTKQTLIFAHTAAARLNQLQDGADMPIITGRG